MKVAFITEYYPVLYHTYIRNQIAGLSRRGVKVTVFSLFRHRSTRAAMTEFSGVADEVHFFEDHVSKRKPRLGRAALIRERRIRRVNTTLHAVVERALFGGAGAIDDYRSDLGWCAYAIEPVAEIVRLGQFDIIHAGFGNKSATAAMILSKLAGIPLSFETHAYDLYVDFKYSGEKIREARRIFTISNYNRDHLIRQHGCPPGKLDVVRVPFDRAFCDSLAPTRRDADLIVSICRLHPIKGLEFALRAIRILVDRRPTIRYWIIGGGALERTLRFEIKRLGLERNVFLRGKLSNRDAIEAVTRAALFLLPSIIAPNGDRDGIPTSMLEAMYLSTPVVSSRLSGIPELVDDGFNGFLTEPGDVPMLAKRIGQLVEDEGLREAMGKRARQKAAAFCGREAAEVFIDHWRTMIQSPYGVTSQLNNGEGRYGQKPVRNGYALE